MKTLLLSALTVLAFFQAAAQVSVELSLDQDEFLPHEAVRLTIKITNRSGQQLHLGADPNWLTFDVEAHEGFVVVKNSEVPVVEPFDLESSQMAIKHVDLEPYFQMGRSGRYKVVATMRIKEWASSLNSSPIHFDVINGGQLWAQAFGVVVNTNAAPEPRQYRLIKANYLREQLRLYLQVGSADGSQIYKVFPLGPLVSFSSPEEQVDRYSQLHVLWQTGAQSFSYIIAGADGSLIARDTYDNFNSRPHLAITSNGEVVIQGGTRRVKLSELPPVKLPEPMPVPPVQK